MNTENNNLTGENFKPAESNVPKSPVYSPLKHRNMFLILSAIISVVIVLIVSTFFIFATRKQNQKIVPNNISPTLQTSEMIATEERPFPLKIFGTDMNDTSVDPEKGNPAPCQPDFFDPKISKYYKIKQDGTPSDLYGVEGYSEWGVMQIDGWNKEGENKIDLPEPFNVTIYNFGCASSFSSVLDLSKNGLRQALYTHVLSYSFSDDGKYLSIVNNINDRGSWALLKRIINIETQEIVNVPNIACASQAGTWYGDRLLTFAERPDESEYTTDICVWNKSGKLISRMGTTSYWGAGSADYLSEQLGLLPKDPDTFYAYTITSDGKTCSLFLADINSENVYKTIPIFDKVSDYPACTMPRTQFDLSNLTYKGGILKYRFLTDEAEHSGKDLWNDWQTINVQ